MLPRLALFLFALLCLVPSDAAAHRANESYVYFAVSDTELVGRFEANLDDLDAALDLDDDGDGIVSEAEFLAHGAELYSLFADRLTLSHDGRVLELEPTENALLDVGWTTFGQIGFRVTGLATVPDAITMGYEPLADVVRAGHLGYALIESNTRTGLENNEGHVSLLFNPGDGPQSLSLVGEPAFRVFVEFVVHGIWHILLGFDHVVFLITLLLASVMASSGAAWVPEDRFRSALWNVTKIVTVFTLSHSVTLSLAALGIIRLPVTFVEAVIAVSIAIVALMNMVPSAHRYILAIVFGFGLFHGFGFANVLDPLAISPNQKIIGLAAFNIGVELGQLAIVLVVFPLLWLLRTWSLYPAVALRYASVFLVFLAGVWFVERAADVNVRALVERVTDLQL